MSEDNPFERLEIAARKQKQEEVALKLFQQARARLVLGNDAKTVFFATLALKLGVKLNEAVETACTDGETMEIAPSFFASLTLPEAKSVICHEVMHVAMKHHTRCGVRNRANWGVACDLAINPLLLDAGMTLPKMAVFPGKGKYKAMPPEKSAEEYYSLLLEQKTQDGPRGVNGNGNGDIGHTKEPGDGSASAKAQAEARGNVNLAQAEQLAKKKGELPGDLARLVDRHVRPKVDWREVLREFVTKAAKNEYRWSPPNRHFIHQELYLPSRSGETLGEITLAVDTSGSIGNAEIEMFGGCIEGIIEAYPVTLRILYHDSKVAGEQRWEPSDGPLQMEPKGGGGTDHRPVFDDIAMQSDVPTCLICFTDLYSSFPSLPPDYPVLWAVTHGRASPIAPFGQLLIID